MIINCLDITVKSASFSAGDSSEFVCLYKGGIFHCHVNFLVHTHINCMCINKIQVMFVGSCINVKVESLKSSERFNFYIYTQPSIHYLYFILLVNVTRVCT